MYLRGRFSQLIAGAVALSAAGLLTAGTLSIGTATSRGTFLLDQAEVPGNGTLFDGSRLKTTQASSFIYIPGRAQLLLASNSEGAIYRDRLVLEKGSGEVGKSSAYNIEALGLHVSPDGNGSQARVTVKNQDLLEVASLTGPVNITGADGAPIAHLDAGRVMHIGLQTETGASDKKKRRRKAGAYAPASTGSYRGVLFLTLLSTAAAGAATAAILSTNNHAAALER